MKKLPLFIFISAFVLLGPSLGQTAFADCDPAIPGSSCVDITCPTTKGSLPSLADLDSTKRTACINEYKGTTKACQTGKCPGTAWYNICCGPKPDTTNVCLPANCKAATICPDTANQETAKNASCGSGKVCCKAACGNCKPTGGCTGNLEKDTTQTCASGQDCCKTKSSGGTGGGTGGTGGGTTGGASQNLADYSPVGDVDIPTLIGIIINAVLGIVGSIALIMFIYGGFLMLISQGDPAKIKKGKDALIWSVLGLVVIFGSYIFVNYIIIGLSGK